MNIVFTKKQLNLIREMDFSGGGSNDDKASASVVNKEGDNDVSSLVQDAQDVAQKPGANDMNKDINVQSYTNKQIPKQNATKVMTISQGGDSISKIATDVQQQILGTPDKALPGIIRLTNGVERDGKLVEVTTFKKKELDKFLKTL
jgi:hypothetical protein